MLNSEKLQGLHPHLVALVNALNAKDENFCVVQGLRSKETQAKYFKKGASQTLNSRHLTGHAVDIVPLVDGKPEHENWTYFYPLAETMKETAAELKIPIEWGGDWQTLKDGAHWQLPWKEYPLATNLDLAATQAAVQELSTKLATVKTDTTPTVRGKTAGFKSSEFWVTFGLGVLGVVDQMANSGLLATVGPVGIAYVIGRPVLKSVLVAAEAYVTGKEVQ